MNNTINKIFTFIIYYILGILGIVLVSCLPASFENGLHFKFSVYYSHIINVLSKLVHFSEWNFHYIKGQRVIKESILSFIGDGFLYTMIILLSSLLLSLVLALLFSYITFLLPKRIQAVIKKFLEFMQSIPDVIFIFLLQLAIVWYYKHFGSVPIEMIYMGEEKIYLAPILSLTILPTILFYKAILMLIEEEWTKDYVLLAKSKGLNKTFIFFIHCIRNIAFSLYFQSKPIVWITLSSILVVQYVFNYNILTSVFLSDSSPFVVTALIILLFTPFFIIYQVVETFLLSSASTSNIKLNSIPFVNNKKLSFKKAVITLGETCKNSIRLYFKLLKMPSFLLANIYILGFTLISFIYPLLKEMPIKKEALLYNSDGKLISAPPHPPSSYFFLGSDAYGYSILDQVIIGAKFTILFVLLIAFIRLITGYLFSFFYLFSIGQKGRNIVSKLADGMQYLPLSFIAFIFLQSTLSNVGNSWGLSLTVRVSIEGFILVILVFPVILNVIGSEMTKIMDEEYVKSSIVIGTSKVRLFFKVITPNVLPKLISLFEQQVIQVIYILTHLGLFQIFLGGTILNEPGEAGPATSATKEWAGMVGYLREALMTGKLWLIIPVFLVLILFILSIQTITKTLIAEQQRKIGIHNIKNNKRLKIKRHKNSFLATEDVVLTSQEDGKFKML